MSYCDTFDDFDYDPACYDTTTNDEPAPTPRRAVAQKIVGGLGLAWITLACGWTLSTNLMGPQAEVAEPGESIVMKTTAAPPAANHYVELFDRTYSLGYPAGTFSAEAPATSTQFALATAPDDDKVESQHVVTVTPPAMTKQLAEAVPLPVARPADMRLSPSVSPPLPQAAKAATLASTGNEQPSILQKLFGKVQPESPMLAYAPADGGLSHDGAVKGAVDQYTAVYDISAHVVYMPDGSKLEAHSGLGSRLDDPRYVNERMRGATPPHLYDLSLRESLFHGVQALRLKPVGGEDAIYGRSGLLAHTFMLGPNGDSNGCVSFKNYDAFLQAFHAQKVKRLMVVAKLG